jgi:hypothetical protein
MAFGCGKWMGWAWIDGERKFLYSAAIGTAGVLFADNRYIPRKTSLAMRVLSYTSIRYHVFCFVINFVSLPLHVGVCGCSDV